MAELTPKDGFDWARVRWTGPYAPIDETCSYCNAAISDDCVPLRLWKDDSSAAVFCEGCMQTWWGFAPVDE
jgi:hypothetical protein